MQIIDVSDEVWMWVYQKYEMSRIVKNYIVKKLKTSFMLLLLIMLYWTSKEMTLIIYNEQTVKYWWW